MNKRILIILSALPMTVSLFAQDKSKAIDIEKGN